MPELQNCEKHSINILMLSTDHLIIDRRILQQAKTLTEAGYSVTVASGFECPQPDSYQQDGFAVRRFTYDWSEGRLGYQSRIKRRIKQALGFCFQPHKVNLETPGFRQWMHNILSPYQAQVIHVHDQPLLSLGFDLARKWNSYLVYDAHEIYHHIDTLSAKIRYLLKRQERYFVNKVNIFSTVNENIADYFMQQYKVRPMVMHNSVPQVSIQQNTQEARRRLRQFAGLPENSTILLYQGWISPERNLKAMVLAAEYLPADAWLVIIGYGEYEKELRAALADKPFKDKVRFCGKVDPSEILALTAGADVGIIPYQAVDLNHELCSPNKFFEFVQSGVPVLSEDLIFFRQMAKQYSCVLPWQLNTAAGIGTGLHELLDNRQLLQSMRANCKKAVEELCWEVEGRKLVDAYAQLFDINYKN